MSTIENPVMIFSNKELLNLFWDTLWKSANDISFENKSLIIKDIGYIWSFETHKLEDSIDKYKKYISNLYKELHKYSGVIY